MRSYQAKLVRKVPQEQPDTGGNSRPEEPRLVIRAAVNREIARTIFELDFPDFDIVGLSEYMCPPAEEDCKPVQRSAKVKDLFDDPQRWCQGYYAHDRKGQRVMPNSGDACSFCLRGAVMFVYKDRDRESLNAFNAIKAKLPLNDYLSDKIVAWNDHPDRTFEEVKELVTALDI